MRIPKKTFGDRIYVEWIDAIEKTGWDSVKNLTKSDDEGFCRTNSFYLAGDKDHLKVASTIGRLEKNDIIGVLWIPKSCITKVE